MLIKWDSRWSMSLSTESLQDLLWNLSPPKWCGTEPVAQVYVTVSMYWQSKVPYNWNAERCVPQIDQTESKTSLLSVHVAQNVGVHPCHLFLYFSRQRGSTGEINTSFQWPTIRHLPWVCWYDNLLCGFDFFTHFSFLLRILYRVEEIPFGIHPSSESKLSIRRVGSMNTSVCFLHCLHWRPGVWVFSRFFFFCRHYGK